MLCCKTSFLLSSNKNLFFPPLPSSDFFYNTFSIFWDIIKTSNSFPAGYAKIWMLESAGIIEN